MVNRATGRLADESVNAVGTLSALLAAKSESVRLGAARSILEIGAKLRKATELEARISDLEAWTNGKPHSRIERLERLVARKKAESTPTNRPLQDKSTRALGVCRKMRPASGAAGTRTQNQQIMSLSKNATGQGSDGLLVNALVVDSDPDVRRRVTRVLAALDEFIKRHDSPAQMQ
jgi:hypothetical protein